MLGRKFSNFERVCPACGDERHVAAERAIAVATPPAAGVAEATYRRALWQRPAARDNAVSARFLRGLRLNASVRSHRLPTLLGAAARVAGAAAASGLFALLFAGAYSGSVGVRALLAAGAALGTLHWAAGGRVRSLALLYGALWALAPVLRLLTDSFSDDTIWAMSGALFALHLLAFPYGLGPSSLLLSFSSLSLLLILIFVCVCFYFHLFFILFSVQLFLFFFYEFLKMFF